MRSFLAGLVVLLLPAAALAQVTGFVESVGFDNHYRPDCWTPMLVNLTSQASTTESFQLQVVQEDLDKDVVTFTREITLNAGLQEKFWVYFLPQPTSNGLPDKSATMLQRVLKVYLCEKPASPGGRGKQLLQLPIQLQLKNVDPIDDHPRGCKLILWISDGFSRPSWLEYQHAYGTMENVDPVRLRPRDLPENALAYQGVDAILWLAGNADELDESGAKRKEAIEQYVRSGGQLVVCQPTQPHRIDALANLLPIDLQSVTMRERKSLEPLGRIARPVRHFGQITQELPLGDYWSGWDRLARQGQFQVAHAKPLEGALVQDWIDWSADSDKGDSATTQPTTAAATEPPTPWLVRRGVGLGSVTWVAQDLGDPALDGIRDAKHNLADASRGWPYVWDHVFGWNNGTYLGPEDDKITMAYSPSFIESIRDLGKTLYTGTGFASKGAALMTVAVVFFIIYWVIAGPGNFFVLAARKRSEMTWFFFAGSALVATALTLLLVRLLLHGPPDIRHRSVVRVDPSGHAQVRSRIGLYIPRDGEQSIQLKDGAADTTTALTPLIRHPAGLKDTEFPAAQDYLIPVHDDETSVDVKVPFRSTLKNIEAQWGGDVSATVTGSARLGVGQAGKGLLRGSLTNQSGYDLDNVYLAFSHPQSGTPQDWVLYLPVWKSGETKDLEAEFNQAIGLTAKGAADSHGALKGMIDGPGFWASIWYKTFAGSNSDEGFGPRDSFPAMSLFDRLPPPRNNKAMNEEQSRFALIRRGARELNRSGNIAAGELVVLGEAQGSASVLIPVPCPLYVDGAKQTGSGSILFQWVLPLDRSKVESKKPGED